MTTTVAQLQEIDAIRDVLEKAYTGARMMEDNEIMLRCARALAAFSAPTDMDIFKPEFVEWEAAQ